MDLIFLFLVLCQVLRCAHQVLPDSWADFQQGNGGSQHVDQSLPAARRAHDGGDQGARDLEAQIPWVYGHDPRVHRPDDAPDVRKNQACVGRRSVSQVPGV